MQEAIDINTPSGRRPEPKPARRGFLALVGGSLFAGIVQRANAAAPTLILPPSLVPAATMPSMDAFNAAAPSGYPLLDAMRANGKSEMHAFIAIKGGVPNDIYLGWLEGGLGIVESCKPGGSIHRIRQMEGRL